MRFTNIDNLQTNHNINVTNTQTFTGNATKHNTMIFTEATQHQQANSKPLYCTRLLAHTIWGLWLLIIHNPITISTILTRRNICANPPSKYSTTSKTKYLYSIIQNPWIQLRFCTRHQSNKNVDTINVQNLYQS